jgi:hypothetical protein
MNDYLLRADDEAALWAALLVAGLVTELPDPSGVMVKVPAGAAALDVIGAIWRPTGAMLVDQHGLPVPEMAPVPGFHANLRTEGLLPDTQLALLPLVTPLPATPDRVWA